MERVCGLGGSTVGAYRLGDCLGHGSHTAVYHASRRGHDCVVKLVDARLQENGKLAARLRREAAVLDLATGTPLRTGVRPTAVLRAALHEQPPSAYARNLGLPPEVDPVLRRALAGEARERHRSVVELVEELTNPPGAGSGRARSLA